MVTRTDTAREEEPVPKETDGAQAGSRAFEGGKQQTKSLLDLGSGPGERSGPLHRQGDRQRHFSVPLDWLC